MAVNQFVPWATGAGANVISATDLLALDRRQQGFQSGDSSSSQFNTVWRQSSQIAATIGQFIAENGATDALDNGNIPALLSGLRLAVSGIASQASYVVDTSTTPGTIVVSRTPRVQAYQPGLPLQVRISQPVVGPTFINADGLGPVPIKRAGGGQLAAGDFLVGDILPLIFDGTQFIVLAAINQAVIDSPITKTVHGTNPDFVDLNAANAWLNRRRVTQAGSVTLSIASGVGPSRIIYSTDVYFSHQDGARISMVGQPLTNQIPSPSALAYTGNRTNDTATNLNTLRGVYSTELNFTGGKKLVVQGDLANMQNILFTSDGVPGSDLLIVRFGTQGLFNIAAVGAANRGIATANGYTTISGICHTIGCGVGVDAGNIVIVQPGAALSGLSCANNGLSGNLACADFTTSQLYARGCGVNGMQGGFIIASQITISRDNGATGYTIVNNGSMNANGCSGSGSPIIWQAGQGGYIDASIGGGYTTTGSATNVAFRAFIGGLINRFGSTATGTNGQTSPAVGTTDANGASIY